MRNFLKSIGIELLFSLGYALLCAIGGISCLMMTAQPNPDGTPVYNTMQSDVLIRAPWTALICLIALIVLDSNLNFQKALRWFSIPMRILSVVLLFLPLSFLWMYILSLL